MLEKYFNYSGDFFFNEFCKTIHEIFLVYPTNKYFLEILDYYQLDQKKFFDELKIKIKALNAKGFQKEIKRSNHAIQDKSYLWPYYSLYFSLELHTKSIKKNFVNEKIIDLIFKSHIAYLRTFDNNKDVTLNKLNSLGQAITRVIEILLALKKLDNKNINEKYFSSYGDLFKNFIETINDTKEIHKYSVVDGTKKNRKCIKFYTYNIPIQILQQIHWRIKKYTSSCLIFVNELYIKYNYIEIDTTRKINPNDKILDSIVSLYQAYIDFLDGNLDISKKREYIRKFIIKIKSKSNEKEITQVLEHEVLTKHLSKNIPESIEQLSKVHEAYREIEKDSPNLYGQRFRNRAYSANETKRNLISSKSYVIPVKKMLAEFIAYMFMHKCNDDEKIYNIIFIFGILSGQSYKRSISIISNGHNEIKVNFKTQEVSVSINKGLFAKKINDKYFESNSKKVFYKIPYLLSLALNSIKRNIEYSSMNFELEESEQKYHEYVKRLTNSFNKKIIIDTKNIHKISTAYLREMGLEDITKMFATAIYSRNDTAKMAYGSVYKQAQYYSDYIELLYSELNIDNVLVSFLSLKNNAIKNKTSITSRKYTGSNLMVRQSELTYFFEMLYKNIDDTKDKYIYFNCVCLYLRYAISLLAGTRTFIESANLEEISYKFKVMRISEKAETKIAGIRVIPLTDTLISLIQNYKGLCKHHELDKNKFHLYDGSAFYIFNANNINSIYGINEELENFIKYVPINFGRHLFTKYAIEKKVPRDYIDAFLGHYSSGLEQLGIYSTLDYPSYIHSIRRLTAIMEDIHHISASK